MLFDGPLAFHLKLIEELAALMFMWNGIEFTQLVIVVVDCIQFVLVLLTLTNQNTNIRDAIT